MKASLLPRIAARALLSIMTLLAATRMPVWAQQQHEPSVTPSLPITRLPAIPLEKPPVRPGCFHRSENGDWQEVPCTSQEYIRQHHFPPPLVTTNSIQSLPHNLSGVGPISFITTPLQFGDYALLGFGLSPQEQQTDNDWGDNSFSFQLNTNYFPCAPCSNGYPFGAISGVSNSASQTGDQGWIQFVYQQFTNQVGLVQPGQQFCIWTVDITIANLTNNMGFVPSGVNGGYANSGLAGYHEKCVPLPPTPSGVLTAAYSSSPEIVGYITCPTNTGCLLNAMAWLPWSNEWWVVQDNDTMGLHDNWINVSGGVLGAGGSSEAVFTNYQGLQQVLSAFSCEVNPPAAESCRSLGRQNQALSLSAVEEVIAPPTGESNNLINAPWTFICAQFGQFGCELWWNSSSPPL
jgi:hypothetical protein